MVHNIEDNLPMGQLSVFLLATSLPKELFFSHRFIPTLC